MRKGVNQQFWDGLNKAQKARLKRYVCGLCEQNLDRTLKDSCASNFGPQCSKQVNRKRAIDCLNASKHKHIRYEGVA